MVVGSPIVLNLIPGGVMPVIMINETDKGYQKEFLIYNGNAPYNVPANVSATIRGTKRDRLGVTEAADVTAGSNVVRITVTEQMTAVPGKNIFELVFVNTSGLRVATANFIMLVERSALNANTVISESDIAYSEQVLTQLQGVAAFKEQLDNVDAQLQGDPYQMPYIKGDRSGVAWQNEYVTPEMFGAKGDGNSDDTQAITEAFASGFKVIGYHDYRISDTVDITGDCEFYGAIVFKRLSGSTTVRDRPALKINGLTNSRIYIREIIDAESYGSYAGVYHGWVNDDYNGILISAASMIDLTIGRINNFSIGLCINATGGVYFNKFRLLDALNCRIGIKINNVNSNGYCNGNEFYDTSFGYRESASGYIQDTQDHICILITSATGYLHNFNSFYGLKFESHAAHAGNYYGLYNEYSQRTNIHDTRIEISATSNLKPFVTDASHSTYLYIVPYAAVEFANYINTRNPNPLNFESVKYVTLLEKNITKECIKYQPVANAAWNGIKQIGILKNLNTLEFNNNFRYASFDADGNISFGGYNPAAIEIKDFSAGDVFEINVNYGVAVYVRYYDADGNNISENNVYGYNCSYNSALKALKIGTDQTTQRFVIPNDNIKGLTISFANALKFVSIRKYMIKADVTPYAYEFENHSYVDTHETDSYWFGSMPTYLDGNHGVGTVVYKEGNINNYYAIEKVNGSLAWVSH